LYQRQQHIEQARDILILSGVAENSILSESLNSGKRDVADVLIEEIRANNYDAVVIAKHRRTKAQEFLFGSITMRLVRECVSNVIVAPIPARG